MIPMMEKHVLERFTKTISNNMLNVRFIWLSLVICGVFHLKFSIRRCFFLHFLHPLLHTASPFRISCMLCVYLCMKCVWWILCVRTISKSILSSLPSPDLRSCLVFYGLATVVVVVVVQPYFCHTNDEFNWFSLTVNRSSMFHVSCIPLNNVPKHTCTMPMPNVYFVLFIAKIVTPSGFSKNCLFNDIVNLFFHSFWNCHIELDVILCARIYFT